MGCLLGKQNLKVATLISQNNKDRQKIVKLKDEDSKEVKRQKIAKSKDEDSKEIKRQKMIEAVEAREKKQKMHGMNEKSYKEYEEKIKRKKLVPNNNNCKPLD
ncbi:hypothetical protein SteCoe_13913 [Stentor coeruleus]|uniref:Uncharacterized protein n=1 Tax=Stentor coeruleus TaxID=5963 RepID=A0A1R2C7B9_9CILI|nr:hypothetical protein SteCoe_13913 [Stentor coeruleus]